MHTMGRAVKTKLEMNSISQRLSFKSTFSTDFESYGVTIQQYCAIRYYDKLIKH